MANKIGWCELNNEKVKCACGCGREFLKYDSRKRIRKYIKGHNSRGVNNIHWKGGRSIDKESGYVKINLGNNRYIYEHRLVMEKYLKRKLKSDEIIHHRNENPQDNRLGNLEIRANGEHLTYHRAKGIKRVYQILNNKIIKMFDSQNQVQRETGISQGDISLVINGKRKNAGGYKWAN